MAAQIYRPPTPRTLPNSCSLGLLGLPLRKRLLAPMVGAFKRIRAHREKIKIPFPYLGANILLQAQTLDMATWKQACNRFKPL